jgi:protein-S-isoprenylcysteine O-methyltransferase Ste14
LGGVHHERSAIQVLQPFVPFIYRTRVLYFFLPLVISIILKRITRGTTSLPLFFLGIGVASLAEALRMYSASYLRGRQVVTSPQAEFLATSGPYAFTRNPLYLGNLLIGLAVCITINEWYAYLLFLASFAVVYSVVIPYEEAFLFHKFGAEFQSYTTATPRLLPTTRPYRSSAPIRPDFRAGILNEIHIPLILAALETIIFFAFVTQGS